MGCLFSSPYHCTVTGIVTDGVFFVVCHARFCKLQYLKWEAASLNVVVFLFQQDRTRSFDGFNMHSLENSLIDIMRAEQDSLKGWFSHQQLFSLQLALD